MNDKKKNPFSWGSFLKKAAIRIPLFLIVLGVLLIISLKLVVRHPESLRAGLEDYFSKATNTRASINSIDKINFFPDMDIRISDLSLHAGNNAATVFLQADHLEVGSPFWSLITPVKRLDNFLMEGVSFEEGFIFKHSMYLEKLEIIEKNGPEQYGAFIQGNGTYADKEMTVEIGIEKIKNRYKLPSSMPVSLNIDNVSVNATFVRQVSKQYFNNVVLKIGDKQPIEKDFNFFVEGEYQTNNPLNCVLDNINEIEECNIYLEYRRGSNAMMKRFYTMVSAKKIDDGFALELDGKTVNTPSGQVIVAPTKALVDAVIAEWAAQEDMVKPETMPLTQILTTSIDKKRDRQAITNH